MNYKYCTLHILHNAHYIQHKPGVGQAGQGVVIISEFVSSARVMRGALNVNPWRVQEVRGVVCSV